MELGSFIKEKRIKLGLSQEDLCDAETAVRSIQRIETGEVIPQFHTLRLIFAKMGMQVPLNIKYVTESEYELFRIQEEITEETSHHNYDIEPLLENFRLSKAKKDDIDWQYYHLHQGEYEKYILKDYTSAKEHFKISLNKSVKKTNPEYDIKERHFVTPIELTGLYELSVCNFELGEKETAKFHFLLIKDYLEKKYANDEIKTFLYPNVVRYLSSYCRRKQDFDQLANLGEQGVDFCIKEDSLLYFKDMLNLMLEGANITKNERQIKKATVLLDAINIEDFL